MWCWAAFFLCADSTPVLHKLKAFFVPGRKQMVVDGLQETLIVVGVPMADVKEVIACMSRIYEQEKGSDQ